MAAVRSRSLTRWLPGWRTLRDYDLTWLRHDIVAGLVLTTMLVAVGLAHAEAPGLGPGRHRCGHRETGLRDRASFKADPLRLHERHRVHGSAEPVAEALR